MYRRFWWESQKERDQYEGLDAGGRIILSRVRGSVTNNNGFWTGCLDVLTPPLQLKPITTAHKLLPKTRSIPYWTTSVFSSAVIDLVLIYESVTSSVSVAR
jgi:hypothetical protein